MNSSKLSRAGAVHSLHGAYGTETCHKDICHQALHISATAKAHIKNNKGSGKDLSLIKTQNRRRQKKDRI